MRKIGPLAAGVVMVALLAGCGSKRGYGRGGPDEFMVARQQPLVIPPDFSLTPPRPGAPQTQSSSQNQTLEALFGANAARSGAETATLDAAGADGDPGIRSEVGDPGTTVVDKGQTTREITAAPAGDGQDARAATPQ